MKGRLVGNTGEGGMLVVGYLILFVGAGKEGDRCWMVTTQEKAWSTVISISILCSLLNMRERKRSEGGRRERDGAVQLLCSFLALDPHSSPPPKHNMPLPL